MPNFNTTGNGKNHKKKSFPKKVVGYVKTNKNDTLPKGEIIIRTDSCLGLLMSITPFSNKDIFSAIPQWQKNKIDFVIYDKEIITHLKKKGIVLKKNQISTS